MKPQDKQKIMEWSDRSKEQLQIGLVLTGDDRDASFKDFCDEFQSVASNVKIEIKKDEDENEKFPFIKINDNLIYHAIPEGPELSPFLGALVHEKIERSKDNIYDSLSHLTLPARIEVFIAPHCPFCPNVAAKLIDVAEKSDQIHLSVIDGVFFPELSEHYNIQSAPTVLLDGQFRFAGSIDISEFVKILTDRDPSKLGVKSLEGMLKDGNASKVAEMMLLKESVFPAFLELLLKGKWPVRLGAMVVVEEIAEKNDSLASTFVPPIMENMDHVESQAKGDMVYLLGECASPELIPFLEKMAKMEEKNIELADAAREAIMRIHERASGHASVNGS